MSWAQLLLWSVLGLLYSLTSVTDHNNHQITMNTNHPHLQPSISTPSNTRFTQTLIVWSTVHYPEQFPVCTYLCILTFHTLIIFQLFSNEVLHCSWFLLSSDPATINSHQYSAKTLWTNSIIKILTCHFLFSTCSFQSINHPAILLTCCL